MAKQAYVYSGTDWVPLASEVTNLSAYQTKASNQFAHRNLLINGDMQIAQRGTSVASITTGGYYTADRFGFFISSMGTWTQSVENDAPTGSGFRKSLKMLCTTADASPAAGDVIHMYQSIEGQNLQQIAKGTSSAKQLTLSFWVKSNVTGTYVAELFDADNTRQTSIAYTISASATWEKKTITFAADTTGAFDNDNNNSFSVDWWLGAGSTYTSGTLQSSWGSITNGNRAAGQTNLASATNNYWQVTGVQLEVGDTATPFEFKTVEDELLECQRYYYRNTANGTDAYAIFGWGSAAGTTGAVIYVPTPVTMRAYPTVLDYSTLQVGDQVAGTNITSLTFSNQGSRQYIALNAGVASGLTQYRFYGLQSANNTSGYLGISAEL